mgnify:CR=1 FL=1
MIPTCYTSAEELALMERQGMALMYDRLRSEESIALYSEGRVKEMIRAEREACERIAGVALLGADKSLSDRVLNAIRARGDE